VALVRAVPPDTKLISLHLLILCVSNNYLDEQPLLPCAVLTDCLANNTQNVVCETMTISCSPYRNEVVGTWSRKKPQPCFPPSEQGGRKHTFANSSRRMASRASAGIAPLILSLSTRWRWVATSHTGRFTSREDPGGYWIVGCLVNYRISLDILHERIISCIYLGSKPGSSSWYPILYRLRSSGASREANVLFLTDLYTVNELNVYIYMSL
jgi:hypothetical protein